MHVFFNVVSFSSSAFKKQIQSIELKKKKKKSKAYIYMKKYMKKIYIHICSYIYMKKIGKKIFS